MTNESLVIWHHYDLLLWLQFTYTFSFSFTY